MEILNAEIPGVLIFKPKRYTDSRGWFSETWNQAAIQSLGVDLPDFVQDNHSFSQHKNTIRGMHFQSPPYDQAKLVRCTKGKILDAAVDIRKSSPTYGKIVTVELSDENGVQLYVPSGFLHGFLTLTDEAEVQYKCSSHYSPEHDGSVLWSSVGIDWGALDVHISPKDEEAIHFDRFKTPFI